jgi:DNA helicase HerA-like ATPase
MTNAEWYYAPFPFNGDASNWSTFLDQLQDLPSRAVVSLCFGPARLTPDEIEAIDTVVAGLEFNSSSRQITDFWGTPTLREADGAALNALEPWKIHHSSLHTAVLTRLSVCADSTVVELVGKALAAAISFRSDSADPDSHRSWTPVLQRPSSETENRFARAVLAERGIGPWGGHAIWQSGNAHTPYVLRRIPYLSAIEHAAGAFVLPVPDNRGCRGFALTRKTTGHRSALGDLTPAVEAGLVIGKVASDGIAGLTFALPLKAVNRHVLVCGAPGSGKTTTVHTILAELWRVHAVPFLAIEPVKNEYRNLAMVAGLEDLEVFTPGKEALSPLRLNPLEPAVGSTIVEHRSAVLASLKAALPLFPPLPELLERALATAYRDYGWSDDDVYDRISEGGTEQRASVGGPRLPSLRDVLAAFERNSDTLEYQGEAKNLIEAMRVRLNSLLIGTKGRTLNTVRMVDWARILQKPVVIELNAIADPEEKAIITALILERVQSAARARGSTRGRLAHVTVLEEAHQLLSGNLVEGPRALAVEALTNAIAELRAVGEGFIIADQRPSAIAAAAVANCGTRIVHKLASDADRRILLADAEADDSYTQIAARLRTGEALVTWPDHDEMELLTMVPGNGVDTGEPMTDRQVTDQFADLRQRTSSLMPMHTCSSNVCTNGCTPTVRTRGLELAEELLASDSNAFGAEKPAGAVTTANSLKQRNLEYRVAYCTMAHGLTIRGPKGLGRSNLTKLTDDLAGRLAPSPTTQPSSAIPMSHER